MQEGAFLIKIGLCQQLGTNIWKIFLNFCTYQTTFPLSCILVKRLILDVPGEWSIVTNFSGQFIRQKRELSHENLAAI